MSETGKKQLSVLVLGNCVSTECFAGGEHFPGIQAFSRERGITDVDFHVDVDPGKRLEQLLDTLALRASKDRPVSPQAAKEALVPCLLEKEYDLIVMDAWTHAMRSAALLRERPGGASGRSDGDSFSAFGLYASEFDPSALSAADRMDPSSLRLAVEALQKLTSNGLGARVLFMNCSSYVPRKQTEHPPYRNCNIRYSQTAGTSSFSGLEEYLRRFNEALEGCSSQRLALLDQERLFIENGLSSKPCVVHLSGEGYGLLCSEILSLLSETFFPELGPQPPSLSRRGEDSPGRPNITDISRDLVSLSASDEFFALSRPLEACFQSTVESLRTAGHRRVAVFGSSASGRVFCMITRKERFPEVTALLDNNTKKWGDSYLGIPILNPQRLPDLAPDAVVIASSGGGKEIARQIHQLTNGAIPVYSLFKGFRP